VNTGYNGFRYTLVHELVHYRFGHTRHGWRFDKLIRAILRGKIFPPTHVHLFGNIARHKIKNIDMIL
jgi:hypothetical protein